MSIRLFIASAALTAAASWPAFAATQPTHSAATVPSNSASSTTAIAAAPNLLSFDGAPRALARGAQKATPVSVSEDRAFSAIFKGGMWLPNSSGGREYAKYDHHLIHDNGDWTWVGKVQTTHGPQSVVITFGKDAVFGLIPQADGRALRLVTAGGRKFLVQTDGSKFAASPENLQLHARQDYKLPPRHKAAKSPARASAQAVADATASPAGAGGGATIDVMVAYTPGLVSSYGSASAALTRINNLVDITNQAYSDSGVSQRIRLVHTMQVNYTDTNDDSQALDDLTGSDGTNPTTIPAALQGIASARTQYGADLVVLLRHFNNAGNNGCGLGWLLGAGEQPIDPTQDNAFGYSVVQDGSDGGYFCLDSTFAHELGHNMGSAHDRAHADQPGAYSYSYGYIGNGTDGFATIMAYGSASQTPLDLFSNPNVSSCQNTPCGVADSSSSSADNAHSLNNTAALIAQFEPTVVGSAPSGYVPKHDVNGDGMSDLILYNPSPARLGWWLMNGTNVLSYNSLAVSSGWKVAAVGDFNGDGRADVVWTDASNNVYIWLSAGSSFTSQFVARNAAGWSVIGAADVDGDGKDDLLVYNPSPARLGWWLMNGATVMSYHSQSVNASWHEVATGDFDGDGKTDVVWTDSSNNVYLWRSLGNSFASQFVANNASGWSVVGAGDVDGDGKADLLVYNSSPSRLGWWLMDGAAVRSYHSQSMTAGFKVASTGDFNGDGKTDIVWLDSGTHLYFWTGTSNGFTSRQVGNYTAGWQIVF